MVYSRDTRSARLLSGSEAQILALCGAFRTLDQHARLCYQEVRRGGLRREVSASRPRLVHRVLGRLRESLPGRLRPEPIQIGNIRELLGDLADQGILVCEADVVQGCLRLPQGDEPPCRISSVAVPTRNRLESLRRALTSYIENCRQYGRINDFVVVDSSEASCVRSATRGMLRSLKAKYGPAIFYAGREEVSRFAQQLIRSGGFPAATVNFCLLGTEGLPMRSELVGGLSDFGANRNAILLHSVGDLVLSVDDDTLCRVVRVPKSGDGLTFSSKPDPSEFWFFPSREVALRSVSFADQDALALHERLLGKRLGTCISALRAGSGPDLGQASPSFVRRLGSEVGGVAVTCAGIVGDSGISSPLGYLLLDGSSWQRLTRSEEEYGTALTERQVLRGVTETTISDSALCMGGCLGLDNRALLPPFMPVQRSEDAIFGRTLRMCFREGYLGFVPWCALHDPPVRRVFSYDDMWRHAGRARTADMLLLLVSSFSQPLGHSSDVERLRALGTHLSDLGSADPGEFGELVRAGLWRQVSRRLSALQSRLSAPAEERKARFWADDVRKYMEAARAGSVANQFAVPCDIPSGADAPGARAVFQELVLAFGQLVREWPDLVQVAKELRARGERLALPV